MKAAQTDFDRYTNLTAQARLAVARKDFARVYQLQGEIETIKNRHGGMPPMAQTVILEPTTPLKWTPIAIHPISIAGTGTL